MVKYMNVSLFVVFNQDILQPKRVLWYSIKVLSFKKSLLYSIKTLHHLKKKTCGIQNYLNFGGLFNKLDFVEFSSEILFNKLNFDGFCSEILA